MSALTSGSVAHESDANVMALPVSSEDLSMRARMETLRDTLLVVGLQVVFRAILLLRRWNY